MTRKRFVKLLMSQGYPRNEANELATASCVYYGSYQEAYDRIFKKNIDVASCIRKAVEICCDVFNRYCKALAKAFRSFSKTYHEALKGD